MQKLKLLVNLKNLEFSMKYITALNFKDKECEIKSTICTAIKNWFIQSTITSFVLSFKNESIPQ